MRLVENMCHKVLKEIFMSSLEQWSPMGQERWQQCLETFLTVILGAEVATGIYWVDSRDAVLQCTGQSQQQSQ